MQRSSRRTSFQRAGNTGVRSGREEPQARSEEEQDVLFSSQDAEVRLLYVYETAQFHGYVLTLLNRNQKLAYHVDVRQFTGKNLVLIGSKDVVVKPGKATRVYIVDFKGDQR